LGERKRQRESDFFFENVVNPMPGLKSPPFLISEHHQIFEIVAHGFFLQIMINMTKLKIA